MYDEMATDNQSILAKLIKPTVEYESLSSFLSIIPISFSAPLRPSHNNNVTDHSFSRLRSLLAAVIINLFPKSAAP